MVSEALLGAALGGGMRLAPELVKYLDNRSSRSHELALQEIELKFAKELGAPRGSIEGGPVFEADISAMREQALAAQNARAAKRYPWVDAASALVRPAVTMWLVVLYSSIRLLSRPLVFGPDDMSLLSGVISFWFLSRVWK